MNSNLEKSELSCLAALYKFYKKNGNQFVLTLQVEIEIGEPVGSLNPTFKSLINKELIICRNGFEISITDKGIKTFEKFLKNEQIKHFSN